MCLFRKNIKINYSYQFVAVALAYTYTKMFIVSTMVNYYIVFLYNLLRINVFMIFKRKYVVKRFYVSLFFSRRALQVSKTQ